MRVLILLTTPRITLHGTAAPVTSDHYSARVMLDQLSGLQACKQSVAAAACLVEQLLGGAGRCGDGVGEAVHGPKHGNALVSAWRYALQLGRILPVVPCRCA